MERLTDRSNDQNDRRLSCTGRCYNAGDCINCDSFENAVDRLAAYEDAEEAGLLIRLPCKVGDTLYEIDLPEYGVIVCKVIYLYYYNGPLAQVPGGKMIATWTAGVEVIEGHGIGSSYFFESVDFGKTVFLTREEAEAALAKDTNVPAKEV